ncbi:MAG: 16S rRNA (adenine(1518)-N(6)/adenine(1519)-N(6))-dimethyltransferase RsmA [Phycisphaerales bacterium]
MQTLTQIRELLERAGHPPKKALGQNFLIDHNLIRKLVDESGVGPGDTVLEVGPGTGALSVELLERGCRLIACELDAALVRVLAETLGTEYPDRLKLIEGDCLRNKRDIHPEVLARLGDRPFTLVANLPYHAATPLMMALMTRHPNCTGMYTTIQNEVVERFAAGPGTKAYGTIGVVAQRLGAVGTIAKLSPACFWPQPGVGSAMMRWVRDPDRPIDPDWWVTMARLTQTLFQSRRKKLSGSVKALAAGPIHWPQGVSPDHRIDAIDPEHIEALCRAIEQADGVLSEESGKKG